MPLGNFLKYFDDIYLTFQTSMAADSHKELQMCRNFGDWIRNDIQYSSFQNYELTYAHFIRFPSWEISPPGSSPGRRAKYTSSSRTFISYSFLLNFHTLDNLVPSWELKYSLFPKLYCFNLCHFNFCLTRKLFYIIVVLCLKACLIVKIYSNFQILKYLGLPSHVKRTVEMFEIRRKKSRTTFSKPNTRKISVDCHLHSYFILLFLPRYTRNFQLLLSNHNLIYIVLSQLLKLIFYQLLTSLWTSKISWVCWNFFSLKKTNHSFNLELTFWVFLAFYHG